MGITRVLNIPGTRQYPPSHAVTIVHSHRYVEIQFSTRGVLQGASLRTYLLERSRVVHVAQGERSFHVFYQVGTGRDEGGAPR